MNGLMDFAFSGQLGSFVLDCAFTAPATGVTALFGPSGCGKTTVLRAIAGLIHLDGHCRINGETWQGGGLFLPPHKRPVGYVFQEASLFPHLSISGNLLYGAPRGLKAGSARFNEVVDLLGLAALLARPTAALSGGERQRVAIGRAILSQPHLMLMDEPLSALDEAARGDILPYLERLNRSLGLPIIYISHDRREVERLADHLVLMRAGRVIASGPLAEVQGDVTLPLARASEAGVTLQGALTLDEAQGLAAVSVKGGTLKVPLKAGMRAAGACRIHITGSDVSLARVRFDDSSILNILPVTVLGISDADAHERLARLALGHAGGGDVVLARLSRYSEQRLGIKVGDHLFAQIKGASILL